MWVVMVLLVVILVVVSLLIATTSKKPQIALGMRAVIVPTSDASRTVIVPPCGTGATTVASTNPQVDLNTDGATAVSLPQGFGNRIVLVPMCTQTGGAAAASTNLPSAAFVANPGTLPPTSGRSLQLSSSAAPIAGDVNTAQLQLTVPPGSPIRTIVVSPCQKANPTGPAQTILAPAPGSTTTAIAPSC